MAPVQELPTGGLGAPADLGVPCQSSVPRRPLGKSNLSRSPWAPSHADDDYIPTEISQRVMKIGLSKCKEPVKPINEQLVQKAVQYIINKMKSIIKETPENNVISYEEARDLLNLEKSPGYPYYYASSTKAQALDKEGELIKQRSDAMMEGEEVQSIFSLTCKSELRQREKVAEGKTRVFMASDMHHLITSKRLFTKQNDQIMEAIGDHPITLGIQMPGPQYVRAVKNLGDLLNDGDLSGCDQRFHPRLARAIRDIRCAFLPERFHEAVNWLYSTVYCGWATGCGGIYRVYGNKSGWENTSIDNSLMTWLSLVIAAMTLFPDVSPDEVFDALINGDDLLVHMKRGSFKDLCDVCRTWNVIIECDDWTPRGSTLVTYLSHHLETRYVKGFGDFMVAAGNLPKLKSSLNWVKRNANLTFEESCIAHLLGIRLCLFPWEIEFESCDEILTAYLKTIDCLSPLAKTMLSARLTRVELARLHTKVEGFSFFTNDCKQSLNLVLKGPCRQIKEIFEMTKTKSQKARAKAARQNMIAKLRVVPQRALVQPAAPRRQRAPRQRQQPLSKCAMDYLKVLEDPFSGAVSCLPTLYAVPSLKLSVLTRGVMYTSGTTGFGGVIVSPRAFCYSNTGGVTAGDIQTAVISTNVAYAGIVLPTYSSGGVTCTGSNSPFNSAQSANPRDLRTRVVACGLRCRNITPLLNRGGQLWGLESPTHDQVDGMTQPQLTQFTEMGMGDVNGSWNSVVYHPVDEDENDYFDGAELGTNGAPGQWSGRSLAFMASAPANDPQIYEFEVYGVYEFTGRLAVGPTPSPADPQGMGLISTILSYVETRRPAIGSRLANIGKYMARIGFAAMTTQIPRIARRAALPMITGA